MLLRIWLPGHPNDTKLSRGRCMRRVFSILFLIALSSILGHPGAAWSEASAPADPNTALVRNVQDISVPLPGPRRIYLKPYPAVIKKAQDAARQSDSTSQLQVDDTNQDFYRISMVTVARSIIPTRDPIDYDTIYKIIIDAVLPRPQPTDTTMAPPDIVIEEVCSPQASVVSTFVYDNESVQVILEKQYQAVAQITAPLCGDYAVYFRELGNTNSFSMNGSMSMRAASFVKMPTLVTLYREAEAGRIDLDTIYILTSDDKRGGAGSLFEQPAGFEITYREMARLMGQESDNTAFNVIAYRVLGSELVQQTINILGMAQTFFEDRITTPEDMAVFFQKFYQENVVSEQSRNEILSFITHTVAEDRIPAGIPDGITVAHKIGSSTGVISDAGIVFTNKPFILVIMTQDANEYEALEALPEITRKIYELWEQQ